LEFFLKKCGFLADYAAFGNRWQEQSDVKNSAEFTQKH
jgi:hypothetical protein